MVNRYQKDDHSGFYRSRWGWQWHQLDHTQVIFTSPQTNNHTSTASLKFLWAECSSCRPTNSVKALKANTAHKASLTYLFICPSVIYNNQRESDSTIGRTDRQICRTYTCHIDSDVLSTRTMQSILYVIVHDRQQEEHAKNLSFIAEVASRSNIDDNSSCKLLTSSDESSFSITIITHSNSRRRQTPPRC